MKDFEIESKARAFVRDSGVEGVPVDIERYVQQLGGKLIVEDLPVGESGYTMQTERGPLISVNENEPPKRRRFTACHEVAHIILALPTTHGHGPGWSYARRPANEIACDVCAAELLLPYRLFMARSSGRPIDFATVDDLSAELVASREATASRLVATSSRACCYVLSERGKVRHLIRSARMRDASSWLESGTSLPKGSVAHALRAGGTNNSDEVGGEIWFDGWDDVTFLESSIFLPDYDQTLTLLSTEDNEEVAALRRPSDTSDETVDNELLKPLDGILPWPTGKKRR